MDYTQSDHLEHRQGHWLCKGAKGEKGVTMVLTQGKSGKNYIIKAVPGEGEVRLHLEGMGFVPGSKIAVVSRMGENLIVNVKGTRVALDRNLAECVVV